MVGLVELLPDVLSLVSVAPAHELPAQLVSDARTIATASRPPCRLSFIRDHLPGCLDLEQRMLLAEIDGVSCGPAVG